MAVRKHQSYEYEEDYIYQEIQENDFQLYQEYIPEAETGPKLSELLFFLNIAAFCILTALFSFVFLSFKFNAFISFSMAILLSLTAIQTYRLVSKLRK